MRNAPNAKREKRNRIWKLRPSTPRGICKIALAFRGLPEPQDRVCKKAAIMGVRSVRRVVSVIFNGGNVGGERERCTSKLQRYGSYPHQFIVDTTKCRIRRLQRLPPARPSLISAPSILYRTVGQNSPSPVVLGLYVNDTGVSRVELFCERYKLP